ncbi:MAG: hypothetical protein FWE77_05700 [Clostridia bacterium]|nr:hypothetical protein [Clostridia bacterium]
MKRLVSWALALLLALQPGAAIADPVWDPADPEQRTLDFHLQNPGLQGFVWPGKLLGDPEKTGFDFIPFDARTYCWMQRGLLENLHLLLTDGKLNVVTGKKADRAFSKTVRPGFGSGVELREDFENFAVLFIDKFSPHLYFLWAPDRAGEYNADMDNAYQRIVYGKSDPILLSEEELHNPQERLMRSIENTMTWKRDRMIWFGNKHPERIRADQEMLVQVLLSVEDEGTMMWFCGLVCEMLMITAQAKNKHALVIEPVKNKELLDYVASPPATVNHDE